jgi:hypothetical protein
VKPVLIGLNNPHSADPARALGTVPHLASGYRLWQMLAISALAADPPFAITSDQYENGFDRYNLLDEKFYDPSLFTPKRRQETLLKLQDKVVVMCGTNVPRTLGLKWNGFDLKPNPVITNTREGFTYYVIPHPSGLCREYNDPDMRRRVGDLLLMLYSLGDDH